ncbi:MAG: hypothetical protein HYY86_02175 [Candidatus Harrisonbacteria bacterium]|nr:hypothetical protein [Candidatus Harrisonbacteria bacterium]
MLKNKRELTFWALGVLMLFIVVGYSGMAIWFLVRNLNAAFNKGIETAPAILRFQLEKAETLKK